MKVRLPILPLVQCLVIIAAFTAVLVLLIRHQHAVFDDMSKELVATGHRSGQEAVLSFFRQRRAMMERSANQMKTLLSVTSCNSSTSCSGELETEATCYPDAMLCPLPEPNVNLTTLRNFFLQSIPLIEGDNSADSVFLLQHTSATFDDANTASDALMLMDKYLQKDSYFWFRANFVALTSSWTALHLNRGNLSTFEQPKSNWTLSITTQRSVVGNTSSYRVDFPFPLLNINNRWIWGPPKASLYHYASDIERNGHFFDSDSYSLPLMIPIVRSPTNKSLSTTILGAHFKVSKLHSLLKNLIQNRTDTSTAVLVWTASRYWLSSNVAVEGQTQLIGAGKNPEEIDIYSRALGRCSSDANCPQVVYFDSDSKKYCGISEIATDVEEGGLSPELHLLLCYDQNVYSKRLSLAQEISLIIGVVGAIVCLGLAFLFLYLIISPLKNVEKAVELVSSMHTDEAAETAFKGINAAITLSEVSSVFLAVGCLSAKLNELKVFIPQALLIEEEGFDDEEEESMKVINHQGSPEDQVYTFVSAKINDTNSHSTGNHDGTSDEEQARHETLNSDSQQAKQNTGFGFWWLFKRGRGSRSQPGNGAQPPLQKPQQQPRPVLQMSPLAQQRINQNAPSPGVELAPEADFDEGDLSFTNSRNSSSYRLHRTASIPRSPAGGQLPLKTSNLNNLNASLFAIGGSQGRDTKIMATPSDHILQQSNNNLADFNNNSMSLFSTSGKAVANPFLKMTGPTVVHSTRSGTQLHPLSSTNHGKAHSNFASFSISQQMNPLVGASDLEQSPSTMNSVIHTPKLRSESVEPDNNVSASANPPPSSHFHKNKNPTVQHREASHAAAHQQPLGLSVGLSMSNFSPAQLKFRRAAVAYINIRNFHELITTRPDAYQIHKIYATIIEEHVNKARGVVDNIHGDQFAITFNVARSLQGINAAAKAAAGSMLDIVNAIGNQKHILPESRHSLAIGVASGKALVAQVGSDHIKKLSTIGPLYNEAVLLSKIAKYVGQHIAITASTNAELEYDAYTALLGMVQIPNAPNLTDGALAHNIPVDVVLGANVVKPPKEVPLFSIMERARPIIGGNEWLYEVNEWTSLNPYAKLNEVMETYLLPEQSGGGVAAAAIKFSSLIDKNKFASDALFPVVLPPSVEAPFSENQSPTVPQTNTSTASSNGQRNPSHTEFADAMHVNTNSNDGTLFSKIKSTEASGIPSPSNSNPPSSGYESGAFASSSIYNKANKNRQNAAGGQNSPEAFHEQAIEVLPSTTPPNSAEWLQNRIRGLLSAGGNHARYTTCQYTRRI